MSSHASLRNSPSRSVDRNSPLPSRAKLRSLLAIGFAGVVPSAGRSAPPRAGADVHHPDVRLVDRFVLDQAESPIVERERVIAPAGAGKRRDLAGFCGSERIDEREVGRRVFAAAGLVDIGRVDEQPVARVGDSGGLVLARRVGQQHRRLVAGAESIELLLLVASGVAREDEHVSALSATTLRNEPARRNRSIA